MKIWTISDSHNKHLDLQAPKNVDMAIFAGDMSIEKDPEKNANEVKNFFHWFGQLPIKYKVVIAGNHDTSLEHGTYSRKSIPLGIIYLQHESVTIEGFKIFGSPCTPEFGKNWAFNVKKEDLEKTWSEIPDDTDILITHGPPKGILDLTKYDSRPGADGKSCFQCGCRFLLDRVMQVQPKYHIFGHIHSEEGCPNAAMLHIQNCKTIFVNATVCDFTKVDDPSVKSIKKVVNNGFIIEI